MRPRIVKILYVGDSITFGLGHDHKGVDVAKRWTSLVDKSLKQLERRRILVFTSTQGVN